MDTTDARLRRALRTADPDRLAAERARAGLCPGCGATERHASRVRADGRGPLTDAPPTADGAWHYTVGYGADRWHPRLWVTDPCGRAVTWTADEPTRARRLDTKAERCLPGAGRAFSVDDRRAAEGRAWLRAMHADALAPLEVWLRARGVAAERRGEAVEVGHHAHDPNAPEPNEEYGDTSEVLTILAGDGYLVSDALGLFVTCPTRPALLRELGYLGFARPRDEDEPT